MNTHSTESYRGYNINIYYDEDPMNPRRDWDNLGTMYTAHRRYCPEKQLDAFFNIHEIFDGKLGKFRESFLKRYIALPLYLYDHSGRTISTSPFADPWDSGFFGIIAVPLEKVREEFKWKTITQERRKQIEKYLQGEVESYDEYLRGEVYGYDIKVDEGADEDGMLPEIDDSCWGFFGDSGIEQIISEARSSIDATLAEHEKKIERERRCEAICDAFGTD